jgi:hypothetical protein
MKKAIEDIAAKRLRPYKRTDLASRLWHHPTLLQYLHARVSRGVK